MAARETDNSGDDFKVERGIPLPARANERYPFDKMNVGDSFTFRLSSRSTVASAATAFGKANQMRFRTAKIDETTCRCWRIE